jgi:hypothetical protein
VCVMDIDEIMKLLKEDDTDTLRSITPTIKIYSTLIRVQLIYKLYPDSILYDYACQHFAEFDNIERDLIMLYFNSTLTSLLDIDYLKTRYFTKYFIHRWTTLLIFLHEHTISWHYIYNLIDDSDIPSSIIIDIYHLLSKQQRNIISNIAFGLVTLNLNYKNPQIPVKINIIADLFKDTMPFNHSQLQPQNYLVSITNNLEIIPIESYKHTNLTYDEYSRDFNSTLNTKDWFAPEYLILIPSSKQPTNPLRIKILIATLYDTVDKLYLYKNWFEDLHVIENYDTMFQLNPNFKNYHLGILLNYQIIYKNSMDALIRKCKYKSALTIFIAQIKKTNLKDYGLDNKLLFSYLESVICIITWR